MKFNNLFLGCLATLSLGVASTALAQDAMSREAIAERLAPVGELCLAGQECGSAVATAAAPAGGDSGGGGASGEEVYGNVCTACHEAGIAGAPARGDEEAWAPRMEQGMATLYEHSINGLNAMPAKGGNPALSDQEVKNAVNYLTEPVRGDDVAIETGDDAAAGDPAAGDAAAGDPASEDAAPEGEAQTASAETDGGEAASTDDTASDERVAPEAVDEDAGGTEQVAATGSDLPGASKIAVCTTCHGQDGQGTAPMYPNIGGQNDTYIENSLKAYRAGERQGGMSAVMTPMAAGLSDEDIKDLAEYYSQQTP